MREAGVDQDRVALVAENGVFFVVGYLAVIRAGMVVVPLQTDLSTETATRIIRETAIATILVSSRYKGQVRCWARTIGVAVLTERDIMASLDDPA